MGHIGSRGSRHRPVIARLVTLVTLVTLAAWDQSTCTWREDEESAQAVCRHISKQIKFGALMDRIVGQPDPARRAAWLATGH
ncbi:hypothetical protein CF335_g5314 [Tilletia laevis]|nr:hypothetical protein CF335_g5314 [Tilletia laevis]